MNPARRGAWRLAGEGLVSVQLHRAPGRRAARQPEPRLRAGARIDAGRLAWHIARSRHATAMKG